MSQHGDEPNDPFAPPPEEPAPAPTPPPPPPPGWDAPPQQPYGAPPSYGQQPPPHGAPPGYGQPPPYSAIPYGAAHGMTKPNNYMPWAVATLILCCSVLSLPLGIAGIVFSSQVNQKWIAGDVAGAMQASIKARNFIIATAVVGFIGNLILYLTWNNN